MQEVRRAGYILIGIMCVAFTCAFMWRPAPPAKFTGLPSVPYSVGGYSGQDVPVDAITKGALAAAEIMSRDYKSPSGRVINLTFIGGTNRSALHDPRSCLVGGGWKISDDKLEPLPGDPNVIVRSCVADISSSDGRSESIDMVYLYVNHGKVISSATQIRLALLEAALFDQSDSPVYFIRFTTPRVEGSDNQAEHAEMLQFVENMWQKVRPDVLGGGHG